MDFDFIFNNENIEPVEITEKELYNIVTFQDKVLFSGNFVIDGSLAIKREYYSEVNEVSGAGKIVINGDIPNSVKIFGDGDSDILAVNAETSSRIVNFRNVSLFHSYRAEILNADNINIISSYRTYLNGRNISVATSEHDEISSRQSAYFGNLNNPRTISAQNAVYCKNLTFDMVPKISTHIFYDKFDSRDVAFDDKNFQKLALVKNYKDEKALKDVKTLDLEPHMEKTSDLMIKAHYAKDFEKIYQNKPSELMYLANFSLGNSPGNEISP